MAILETIASGFKEYPGGRIIASIPVNDSKQELASKGTYIPEIQPGNPVMAHVLYLKGQEHGKQIGIFEERYPYKKAYGPLISLAEYNATLAHHGVPPTPEYNQDAKGATYLWTPSRQEITIIQFPIKSQTEEARVTQVKSKTAPPVDHQTLPNGKHLQGALKELGFDPNDFSFLAGGASLRQLTGIGANILASIVPERTDELIENIATHINDTLTNTLPPDMGYLTHTYRAGIKRSIQGPK